MIKVRLKNNDAVNKNHKINYGVKLITNVNVIKV